MLLTWLQVTFKAISDVLFLPHRLLAYEQKVCARVGAGGVHKATNMGALKTTSRRKRIGMRLGNHNCFPFSGADLRYLAMPMAQLPPGEGFGGTEGPQNGSRPQRGAVRPQPWQTPPSSARHELCWAFAGKDSVRGLYLGQFHIFEQIFQCGSTLGFRYLLKRSKRKWSSSIS